MEEVVSTELARLVEKYRLRDAPVDGNEDRAVEGEADGNPVRVELYSGLGGPWLHVELVFGEVRHAGGRSGVTLGERGVVRAASDFGPDWGGSALAGHAIEGFRWRVTAVAPRCRTSCEGPGGWRDGYVTAGDIVEHLLTFEESCSRASGAEGDLFLDAWESALPAW